MNKGNNAPLFMIFAVLLTFLLAIGWIQARNESQYISQLIENITTIQSDDYNLHIQLQESIFENDTDAINHYSNMLINSTSVLKENIKRHAIDRQNETDFIDAIYSAHQMRHSLIEDFKTHNAIINNSLYWLRHLEKKGDLNAKDSSTLHHLKDSYYARIPAEDSLNFPSSSNVIVYRHLNLLNYQIEYLHKIRLKLDHSRTDGLLEKLKNHYQIQFDEIDTRRLILMWMFIAGIFLSLGLILYFYWRERQSASHSLKLANELEQVFDALSSTNIVSKTNLTGHITYANDAFCLLSGYSREELIGRSHNIIRHPDTSKEIFIQLWSTLQNGNVFHAIIKNRAKDGNAYYVDSTIIPIKDETGEIFEYLAIRNDITALVKARDEAIAAEQFKDRFLSNMSHELRTPLNGIIGFTQLLKEKISDNVPKKYINIILESSKHLLSIINDILDLSKIKSGKFALDEHPFSIYTSLMKLLEPFSIQAQTKKINFTSSVEISQSTLLKGDSLRISQIINNLLSNALKFTPEEGKVSFKASYHDGYLECKVADSGIGMDEKTVQRIFQPFIQADISTTREFGGTGLGLSITKELVDLMHGSIDVYSKPGSGSRFTVRMALKTEEPSIKKSQITATQVHELPKLNGNILIVEDNETNRLLISSYMEAFGLSYECVENGQEAVELFQKDRFDLILMDENMPKLNGIEAMKQIRALPGGILPIIALTANAMEGDKERFENEGMDAFLSKPIIYKDLVETLQRYLPLKT